MNDTEQHLKFMEQFLKVLNYEMTITSLDLKPIHDTLHTTIISLKQNKRRQNISARMRDNRGRAK